MRSRIDIGDPFPKGFMKTASRLLLVLISPLALLGFGAADFSPADIVAESLELTPLQHGNSDQVNKWVGEVCIQDVSLDGRQAEGDTFGQSGW